MDVFGFGGKRVLVTGATSGIGFDVAKQLIAHQCKVAILGRDQSKLDQALQRLGEGIKHAVVADLNSLDTLAGAVASAISSLGGLDVLVISGGNGKPEYLGTDPDSMDSYEFLNRVHVQATLKIVQAAEAALVESGGNVVAVTSLASDVVWPQTQPYNCAKAAQHALLKNLALTYVKRGVRVNAVLPACIHTDALDVMAAQKGVPAEVYAAKRGRAHPMQRAGKTAEVTSAVLFLASNKAASFITGHFLNVDGGLSLTNWFNTKEMLTIGPEDVGKELM